MTCGRDASDEYTLDPESVVPPAEQLPSEATWGDRRVYYSEADMGELKRRMERVRQELACWRRCFPGMWYSVKHDILVDAAGLETLEAD